VSYDCIIIGGGAAGLYCARTAGWRGRKVLVLEHNREIGAKILISGGGRCNFTNIHTSPECFISANPHFCRSALARHPPEAFVTLVRRNGIAFYEKTLGQLFCEGAGAANKIVSMLADNPPDVHIRTGCTVTGISRADSFRVETSQGTFTARALVIATGGLSIPKLGATDFAHRVARQFGLKMVTPRAGLVPLTFGSGELPWMALLSGLSTPAVVSVGGTAFQEALLFTHRGLSGPAILQASSYWREGEKLSIDWLPELSRDFLVKLKAERARIQIKTALAEIVPARLADVLRRQLPGGTLAEIKDQFLLDAADVLKQWPVTPIGTEGFAKAEVTIGGVDVNELSQQTMEARKTPGLYFIGEAVDVTGWLGGYNFQWAWASAHAAAQAL
jgi:predicted Rossmann fold flavoprotein